MSSKIRILSEDLIAKIAAGEIVERPASVVKELIENSIDAGGTLIFVDIKAGGMESIRVVDNGCGMSETDARMSFERHSTSKIKDANDLFTIRTMGFRGEALASIAAVAHVELKTKLLENELGTHININASKVISHEPVSCSNGSNFAVKNIFFNIPARRKFLKSDSVELKHIIIEFQRIALSNHDMEFSLYHNKTEIYNLPKTNPKQRIIHIFKKNMDQGLVSLSTDTSMAKIYGFAGKPEFAKKKFGEQFFFINNMHLCRQICSLKAFNISIQIYWIYTINYS